MNITKNLENAATERELMKRIALLLCIVLIWSCKWAPDGKLYVKYDVGWYSVTSLSDDNPSTPAGILADTYYEIKPGEFTVTYSLDGGSRAGSYTYSATIEDEEYINSEGGIWTPGEDKYYEIALWDDPPSICIWSSP